MSNPITTSKPIKKMIPTTLVKNLSMPDLHISTSVTSGTTARLYCAMRLI